MGKPRRRDLPDLSDLASNGAEIAVRITPKAAKPDVKRDTRGLRISVTVAPESGKANAAVRDLLATAMGVAPSRLTLRRGHISRDKVFVYSDG